LKAAGELTSDVQI